jgi:hypothetical protein
MSASYPYNPLGTYSIDRGGLSINLTLLRMLGACLYVYSFHTAYTVYLARYWDWWGFHSYPKEPREFVIAFAIASLPSIWLKSKADRPSMLFMWVIFVVIYVPSIVVSYNISNNPNLELSLLWIFLLAGFAIMAFIIECAPIGIRRINLPRKHSTGLLVGFGLFFFVIILAVNGRHINIFAFTDVYKQRAIAGKVESSAIASYGYWWLSVALLPFGLLWGLHYRKWLLAITCFMAQIVMFGVAGSKLAGLTAFATPFLYFAAKKKIASFGVFFIWLFALIVAGATFFAQSGQGIAGIVISTLLGRTLGVPGLTTLQYYNFFEINPHTYWSHINFIGLFVDYPYSMPLHYLFGSRLYGSELLSLNANFWATDGVAAFGLIGILLISILAGITLRAIDEASRHMPGCLTVAWALAPAMALSNIGLFTAILSQGLGVMILIAMIASPPDE